MSQLSPLQCAHRDRYLPLRPPGQLLVGSADRFADVEGAARTAWGKPPVDPAAVRHLHLEPTPAQLARAKLPGWVDGLPALRSLVLPAPLLHDAAARGLLAHLDALTVVFERGHAGAPLRWPEAPLPELRALSLLGLGAASDVPWEAVGVASAHAPGLELLRLDVDTAGQALDAFADAAALVHVEIVSAPNLDTLSRLPPGLRHLHLNTRANQTPFAPITRFERLETLALLNARFEIDCALLSRLPALREVHLWSTKKLRHVDALLALPALESLQAVDCGRPFDKGQKAQLQARALPHLYIDFA